MLKREVKSSISSDDKDIQIVLKLFNMNRKTTTKHFDQEKGSLLSTFECSLVELGVRAYAKQELSLRLIEFL